MDRGAQPPWLTSWRGSRSGGSRWAGRGRRRPPSPRSLAYWMAIIQPLLCSIVDNVDLVGDDEAVMTSLALFLSSLPEWLHVVLLSRRTPKLPIDRLRARGRLGRGALHRASVLGRGSRGDAERTGVVPDGGGGQGGCRPGASGWAAGLQLTALAARSRAGAAGLPLGHVGDGDLFFADYVRNEVLAAEPHAIVELSPRHLRGDPVQLALGVRADRAPDAGELLLEAESRGLFVTRLGPSELGRGARGVARRTA